MVKTRAEKIAEEIADREWLEEVRKTPVDEKDCQRLWAAVLGRHCKDIYNDENAEDKKHSVKLKAAEFQKQNRDVIKSITTVSCIDTDSPCSDVGDDVDNILKTLDSKVDRILPKLRQEQEIRIQEQKKKLEERKNAKRDRKLKRKSTEKQLREYVNAAEYGNNKGKIEKRENSNDRNN